MAHIFKGGMYVRTRTLRIGLYNNEVVRKSHNTQISDSGGPKKHLSSLAVYALSLACPILVVLIYYIVLGHFKPARNSGLVGTWHLAPDPRFAIELLPNGIWIH